MDRSTAEADEDWNLPTEISREEYASVKSEIAELSEEEARQEWMESCRYGEVDIVRALLCHSSSLINYVQPNSGNTGLHMAAANGHIGVVKLLLKRNHTLTTNGSGNTPLHWAAERGQAEIVQILTTNTSQEVDVLQKNDFGRSALTEGFSSQNEFVVKSLLEHDSASEEKLLSTDGKSVSEVTHEFFEKEDPLLVRELAITNADNPFADTDKPDNDTTGLSIWAAALVLARWMRSKSWKGASVLELGAGCGVPGLAIAKTKPPAGRVYITDLNPRAVENIEHNIALNSLANADAIRMDWNDTKTWPEEQVDYVVGSDLVYQKALVPLLTGVLRKLLRPAGTFFYVAPRSGRDGLDEFIKEMKRICTGWEEVEATTEFLANPLASQDDEECFVHFQELSTLTFVLYTFPFPKGP